MQRTSKEPTFPNRWPKLDYEADKPVIETCHAYLQVIGKLPTRARAWSNHGWQLALRVVPRGFRTYPVVAGEHEVEVLFDCLSSEVVIDGSDGSRQTLAITGQTVADFFFAEFAEAVKRAGVEFDLAGAPNEVEPAIPFAEDNRERHWDADTVRRIHAAFRSIDREFETFRGLFVGKSSPSHLFWGSFDLAVTRFSGREAPLHPGGVPNLPDRVTREAYSHEVASAGFWLGGGGIEEACFYAYGYPTPEGVSDVDLGIAGAYWHEELGEFVLPYAEVRAASDPGALLQSFLQRSYEAVAEAGNWEREDLELPAVHYGRPYDLEAHRSGA